jgi:translation initiation factor 1 (eIF-1/SUI1)
MDSPLVIDYCSVCGWPCEYCCYGKKADACKIALKAANPELYAVLYEELAPVVDSAAAEAAPAEDGAVPAADVAVPAKPQKVKKAATPAIILCRANRGGKKCVTLVYGLDSFGIDARDCCSVFKKACGAGASLVTEDLISGALSGPHVEIQGDVKDTVTAVLADKYSVPVEAISEAKDTRKKGRTKGKKRREQDDAKRMAARQTDTK